VATTVVAVLPLLVAIPLVLVDGMTAPNGDDALIELRVRDVWGIDSPLTGSYGRFGWNHPGPLLFYVLSVPYRLVGARFAGLQVGTLLLGIASVVGIAWVAARRGGAVLALWALFVVSVLVHGLGPRVLSDPWEPHSTVLPATLLLFLAWDTAAGRAWSLPLLVGVGSLLAAAQATLLPLVAALVLWAVVGMAAGTRLRRRRGRPVGRRSLWLAAGTAVALGVVLWLPAVVEELKNSPGNLSAMWEFVREPQDTLGLADGWRSVALQLGTEPTWLGFDPPLVAFATTVDTAGAPAVPLGLVALAVGLALAAWRRDDSLLLGATALVALGAGVVGMSQLVGDLFPWLLEWTRILGAATWLAAGWCAFRALGESARARLTRVVVPVLAAGIVVASVAGVVDAVRHRQGEDTGLQQAIDDLSGAGARAVADVDGRVLVRSEVRRRLLVFGEGIGPHSLALGLEREGVEVVVERRLAYQFGDHRARPTRAEAELVLVSGRPRGAELAAGRVVATADPLTREQRAERGRLDRELARRGGGSSTDLAAAREAVARDPSLRALLEASDAIPDLPVLSLVERPLP
jgi:hypothetical protein